MKIKSNLWLLIASMLLILAVMIFFFPLSLVPFSPTNPQKTYTPFKYDKKTVMSICELLRISDSDIFCVNPSRQTVNDFSEMLYRNFPVNITKYNDIVPYLKEVKSRSELVCWNKVDSPSVFRLDNCPPPESCSQNYACTFYLPSDSDYVGAFQISFDKSSSLVGGYTVINPADSTEYSQ